MESATQTQPAAESRLPTVILGGVPVTRLGLKPTLSVFAEWLEDAGRCRRAATANLDFLEIAGDNDELRNCLATADIVTADGEPLIWLSKLRGQPITERVAGADFVPLLVGEAARLGKSVYFLGGEDGVAQEAIDVLKERYPKLIVAGHSSPMVHLDDETGCEAIAEQVADTQADLVLVAFGCPKQDLFIERYLDTMDCRLAVGVGGTFNFIAGRIARAPAFMQRTGIEWIHRLAMEPRRLLGRYIRDGLCFLRLSATIVLSRSFSVSF